jgi:hypothetical protein
MVMTVVLDDDEDVVGEGTELIENIKIIRKNTR